MKSSVVDFGTQCLRLILTTLGSEHRTRVTIGLVLGSILWGAEDYLAAVFVTSIALSQLPAWGKIPSLAVGIGIAFLPLAFRKRVLPKAIIRYL